MTIFELYIDTMEINFKDCDTILEYRASQPMFRLTMDDISIRYKNSIDNIKLLVDIMTEDGLFERVPSGKYSPFIMITPKGISVSKNGGYEVFCDEKNVKLVREQKIQDLTFKQLEQSVKINKWQFVIMLVGGFGGIVSFLILLYQFLLGTDGFLNDVFK